MTRETATPSTRPAALGSRRAPLGRAVLATIALALIAASCASEASPARPAVVLHDRSITVASFAFPESELLAQIYGQALRRHGHPVVLSPNLGPRELVDPALVRGLVEVVPDYAGTALHFLSSGTVTPVADVGINHRALVQAAAPKGLVALEPAPAQNANAVVVTRDTAERHGLRRISDLAPVASELTFGGPPECPTRPFCLAGLEQTYGLEFKEFLPLDAGGPLTHQALTVGDAQVVVLFTTDPHLANGDLVELIDDRRLQPAENVTPLAHAEVLRRRGPGVAAVLDDVSRRLSTDGLRRLNEQMAVRGRSALDVAAEWLRSEGLR